MSRAPWNDVVSVYSGPLSPVPGTLVGQYPCRMVLQEKIRDQFPSPVFPVAWFTCPQACILTRHIQLTAGSITYDYMFNEQLVFDSFVGGAFIAVSWEWVLPPRGGAYNRFNIVPLSFWPGIPVVVPP